jgi:hypothetical protein
MFGADGTNYYLHAVRFDPIARLAPPPLPDIQGKSDFQRDLAGVKAEIAAATSAKK